MITKILTLATGIFLSNLSFGQLLGIYEFTGTGACPNQNPTVTAQPIGGNFSTFSSTGVTCIATNNFYNSKDWETSSSINLGKYYEFSISADNGKSLQLDSLIFANKVSSNTATWYVRSNIDNYGSNLSSGQNIALLDTVRLKLNASHSGISSVTFRLYASSVTDNQRTWRVDDVTVKGTITTSGASLETINTSAVQLYPNPTSDFLTIDLPSNSSIKFLKIYSSTGKLIHQEIFSGTVSSKINVQNFDKGIYLLALESENNLIMMSRWIKE